MFKPVIVCMLCFFFFSFAFGVQAQENETPAGNFLITQNGQLLRLSFDADSEAESLFDFSTMGTFSPMQLSPDRSTVLTYIPTGNETISIAALNLNSGELRPIHEYSLRDVFGATIHSWSPNGQYILSGGAQDWDLLYAGDPPNRFPLDFVDDRRARNFMPLWLEDNDLLMLYYESSGRVETLSAAFRFDSESQSVSELDSSNLSGSSDLLLALEELGLRPDAVLSLQPQPFIALPEDSSGICQENWVVEGSNPLQVPYVPLAMVEEMSDMRLLASFDGVQQLLQPFSTDDYFYFVRQYYPACQVSNGQQLDLMRVKRDTGNIEVLAEGTLTSSLNAVLALAYAVSSDNRYVAYLSGGLIEAYQAVMLLDTRSGELRELYRVEDSTNGQGFGQGDLITGLFWQPTLN